MWSYEELCFNCYHLYHLPLLQQPRRAMGMRRWASSKRVLIQYAVSMTVGLRRGATGTVYCNFKLGFLT